MSRRAIMMALGAIAAVASAPAMNRAELRNHDINVPKNMRYLKDPKPGRLWKHGKNRQGGHRRGGGRGR